MAIAAVVAGSRIRAQLALYDYEDRHGGLRDRQRLRLAPPRPAPPPEAYPAWNASDDDALFAAATKQLHEAGGVHWGDVARTVHRRSGVLATAADCRRRYEAASAPGSLLGACRAAPGWRRRFSRLRAAQVATPVDDDAGKTRCRGDGAKSRDAAATTR